jgi:hypothetical protein
MQRAPPRRRDHPFNEYDLDAAIKRLRATGWPGVEEFLKHSFLDPIQPGWVSEFFERQAQEADKSSPS